MNKTAGLVLPRMVLAALAVAVLYPTVALAQVPSTVRLNEVLANSVALQSPDGTVADWIELYNTAALPVDLSDTSLTDSEAEPRRFVFPAGTTIPASGYRVVRCSPNAPVSATNTGFGLKQSGSSVYFYDKVANGGGRIDMVSFGLQAADYPIGRVPGGGGNWVLTTPTPGAANLAATLGSPAALRINEWLANPTGGKSDFIELYNTGTQPVALSGLYLTDDLTRLKSLIGALSFVGVGRSGGFALFIADNNPAAGPDHLSFGLDGAGEQIGLYDGSRAVIHALSFIGQPAGGSEGFLPDGSNTRVAFPDTPSPGAYNRFLALITNIVINELLTHTDPPFEDAIEFQNVTDSPVDLGGWLLTYVPASDVSFEETSQFRFPDNTIVSPRGFSVFYEEQLNAAVGMRFNSAHGGKLVLYQSDATGAHVAFLEQSFPSAQNGVSFGRYPTSEGGYDFVAMSALSFGVDHPRTPADFVKGRGMPNPGPLVGPVVISEVMYRPPDLVEAGVTNDNRLDEYIELRNITGVKIPMFNPRYPDNRWRLRDAVDFDGFPARTSLGPHAIVLIVPFDPRLQPALLAAFRAKYNIPGSVPIFGPYSGELNNSSDSVELVKPDPPQSALHPDVGFVPYILVDKVKYRDSSPWPVEPDGAGASLQRRNPFRYGNDVLNWKGAAPTPGLPNGDAPAITTQPQSQALVPGQEVTFRVSATGTAPLTYQWRHNGAELPGAIDPVLTLPAPSVTDAGNYSVVVSNDEGPLESAQALLKADTAKPTITIVSPKTGVRVTNNLVRIQGTAKDDLSLAQVRVSVNGGIFELASSASPGASPTSWSFEAQLVPGTNLIAAKAIDTGLNESASAVLRVLFVVVSPFTLTFEHGTVTPNLNGQSLEVGRSYTLKATPDLGYLFSDWSGGWSGVSPSLVFQMHSNLNLAAHFVPNPFVPVKGLYAGLFFETTARHESSGLLSLKLTDSGAFTGLLQRGSKRSSLKGSFDLAGRATNHLSLDASNSLSVELALDWNSPGTLSGRILGPGWLAELNANRAVFNAAANPCPQAGAYTLLIAATNQPGPFFAGDGFATFKLAPAGTFTLAGTLADGSKAVLKGFVSADGRWPIYLSLDGGAGSLLGWCMAEESTADDLRGILAWFKPSKPLAKLYPDGFSQLVTLTGSRYRPPDGLGHGVLAMTDGTVTFNGGDLDESFTDSVGLSPENRVLDHGTNQLTWTFKLPTGLFSGKVGAPGSTKILSFKGAVHQKANLASGYFPGTNQTGRVQLSPP